MLTVGSLFAGIGGFDLGLERAGMRTVWFCEQDPFCQRVLARHWPGVPCHPDVRALVADTDERGRTQPQPGQAAHCNGHADAGLRGEHDGDGAAVPVPVPYVDVLCGGFPCQDISLAGRGAGLAGERSGLWREFARLIGELRPRYVIVENVPALTVRGLDVVLADLAACGFDAEWDHLPASAFGAPHRRDRIWLVAYSGEERRDGRPGVGRDGRDATERRQAGGHVGDRSPTPRLADSDGVAGNGTRPTGEAVSRPGEVERLGRRSSSGGREGLAQSGLGVLADGLPSGLGGHWDREPDVGRVAVNVPQRVDKLRALGNALVPQIAEWIGTQIINWEKQNDKKGQAA